MPGIARRMVEVWHRAHEWWLSSCHSFVLFFVFNFFLIDEQLIYKFQVDNIVIHNF